MPLDRTFSSTERAAQERRLMDDYVRGTGQDPQLVRARTDEAARMLVSRIGNSVTNIPERGARMARRDD